MNWLIVIHTDNLKLVQQLALIYGPFITSKRIAAHKLVYRVRFKNQRYGIVELARTGQPKLTSLNLRDFFYLIEKDITIELQRKRRELYFVHSAVVGYKNSALMIVAPSGTGKSTTTWGLLNNGFSYLSDELAPIHLDSLMVEPYPRALGLKAAPPLYSLPKQVLRIGPSFHLPLQTMDIQWEAQAKPLSLIFFLHFNPEVRGTTIQELTGAAGAVQLYANTLNALNHPGKGLDGAIAISTKVPCYRLISDRNLEEIISAMKDAADTVLG